MTDQDFYSHVRISDRTYLVRECYGGLGINIGVIIGQDRVLVIDSGLGACGGLRDYIERNITDRGPMICYMTHGHIDHASGSPLFDEIHLNARDWPYRAWNEFNIERRYSDLFEFCKGDPEVMEYCRDRYVRPNRGKVLDVEDGDVIALGGAEIECYAIPGHSMGSMAYYFRAENIAFVGDQIARGNVGSTCCDAFDYTIEKLRDFIDAVPADVTLFHGHAKKPLGIECARSAIAVYEEIIAGKTWHDEYTVSRHAMTNPVMRGIVSRKHAINGFGITYAENYYPPAPRNDGERSTL